MVESSGSDIAPQIGRDEAHSASFIGLFSAAFRQYLAIMGPPLQLRIVRALSDSGIVRLPAVICGLVSGYLTPDLSSFARLVFGPSAVSISRTPRVRHITLEYNCYGLMVRLYKTGPGCSHNTAIDPVELDDITALACRVYRAQLSPLVGYDPDIDAALAAASLPGACGGHALTYVKQYTDALRASVALRAQLRQILTTRCDALLAQAATK